MARKLTAYALRDAVAEILAVAYKAYEIDAACDGFGIPPHLDAWTYNSKRVYVRNRLTGVQLPEMLAIAQRVLDEHPDDALERLLSGSSIQRC